MNDLTTGKAGSLILKFALPMLLGNVFQQLYNIVDSIIVGNFIGKEALAAVGASFPIIFAFLSLIIGIASGSTIVIAQYFGAKDIEKVKRTINTLFIFLFFASIVISIVGIIFSEDIFRLLKLPEEIIPQATTYFNIFIGGVIVSFGFNGTSAILRGLGDSKTPLYFLIISTIINIGLDLLFVLVFKWGIAGVAIASVMAQGGAFLTAIIYLNRTHKIVRFSFKGLAFDKEIFKKSVRIGLPTGIQQTFVALGMTALIGIVNTFGTNVIAAYSVVMRISSLASLPAMNFAAALSTFVGQNIGAKKIERVRSGFISTLKMSSLMSITVSAFVLLGSGFLMNLFTNDSEVIRIGKEYLMIVGGFYVIFSAMFSISGVMRGAGDTLVPMFISLISLWIIRIPGAWLLSREFGEAGIWWSMPIGWFVGFTLSYIYYLTGNWKKKVII
ncbi:MAG: MATE family efflux transporter [Bacteroidales bacterium]|nr:MATE family efflux transporter [Bacteroidales bacterium]